MPKPPRRARRALERILQTPDVALIVPRLQPETLHRVIQTCGLEACGEFVALATSDQLAKVFDLDLWRAPQPGLEEQLDADRFGLWLEVLMEAGAAVAAQKLAGIDDHLVVAAFAQHVRVFDRAAGQVAAADCELGSYSIQVKRTDAWDAIFDLLVFLHADDPDYFHRLMRGCRRLSNSLPEIDGLDDLLPEAEQHLFDVAADRDTRRERQGYVTPAEGRAFLRMARQPRPTQDATPSANPLARGYFRTIEPTPPAESDAAVLHMLVEAGLASPPQQPRFLLRRPEGDTRFARIRSHMEFVADVDPAACATRSAELAYLANNLIAGCAIQGRPFTPGEASDAVAAVCNLGLENWPRRGVDGPDLPQRFLVEHDLIGVFEVGWTVLHRDVCMHTAQRLVGILAEIRCSDDDTQSGLDALRRSLARHREAGAPWLARDAFDVLAIFDMTAWAALLSLVDECPVIHAAMRAPRSGARSVSPTSFEFVSENCQIAEVHAFLRGLPDILTM
jgi:hypothetical protein